MLEACTAAVFQVVGVRRLDSWAALSILPDAWSVRCAGSWSLAIELIVVVSYLLYSSAVPDARS